MGDVPQSRNRSYKDRRCDRASGKPLGVGAHPFDPGENSLVERTARPIASIARTGVTDDDTGSAGRRRAAAARRAARCRRCRRPHRAGAGPDAASARPPSRPSTSDGCRRSSDRSSGRSARRRCRKQRATSGAFSRSGTRRKPKSVVGRLRLRHLIGQEHIDLGSRTPRRVNRKRMPELPEVETVRRGLALKMSGRRILQAELRRPDLRRPFPPALAARLDGARIGALGRRGKYILIELEIGRPAAAPSRHVRPDHGRRRSRAGRAARSCGAEARRRHRHPLQRSPPLRADRLRQARRGDAAPAARGARPGAARSRIQRRLSRRERWPAR